MDNIGRLESAGDTVSLSVEADTSNKTVDFTRIPSTPAFHKHSPMGSICFSLFNFASRLYLAQQQVLMAEILGFRIIGRAGEMAQLFRALPFFIDNQSSVGSPASKENPEKGRSL